MNIFFTDKCPRKCALYLDDKRVNKMILETAQMLSTAITSTNSRAISKGKTSKGKNIYFYNNHKIYSPTHINHPSNIWVRESKQNYIWTLQHFLELCKERYKRKGKSHKSFKFYGIFKKFVDKFPDKGLTKKPNCAANKQYNLDFKHINDIEKAYKLYLNERFKNDKIIPICSINY